MINIPCKSCCLRCLTELLALLYCLHTQDLRLALQAKQATLAAAQARGPGAPTASPGQPGSPATATGTMHTTTTIGRSAAATSSTGFAADPWFLPGVPDVSAGGMHTNQCSSMFATPKHVVLAVLTAAQKQQLPLQLLPSVEIAHVMSRETPRKCAAAPAASC